MIYLYIFYRLVLVFFIPAGCLYFFLVSLLSYQRNHQTSSLKTKEIKCLQRHSDRLFMSTISSTSDKTDPQLQWILYCSIHRSLGSTDLRPIHKLANHDSNSTRLVIKLPYSRIIRSFYFPCFINLGDKLPAGRTLKPITERLIFVNDFLGCFMLHIKYICTCTVPYFQKTWSVPQNTLTIISKTS